MKKEDVLDVFRASGALLEGHFVLSSGRRSATYLQCARVMMYPDRAEKVCRSLAHKIVAAVGVDAVDYVVSPAMGGVVVGYEVGRQLGVATMFTERVEGKFELRRGFDIEKGARVLMAEDVVTTGKSSRECIETIEAYGGKVVAASCLVDRSNGTVDLDVPLVSLVAMSVPSYAPDELPDELAALPAVKPGSRNLK